VHLISSHGGLLLYNLKLVNGILTHIVFGGRYEGHLIKVSSTEGQSHSYITTDSQSASLSWCQTPIWDPRPNFPFLFFNWQFGVYWCGESSLTRGWICNLLVQFWALPEQSLSGPGLSELMTIFYCFIWDSTNLEGRGLLIHYIRSQKGCYNPIQRHEVLPAIAFLFLPFYFRAYFRLFLLSNLFLN
jgi:hypothetical protein